MLLVSFTYWLLEKFLCHILLKTHRVPQLVHRQFLSVEHCGRLESSGALTTDVKYFEAFGSLG